MHSPKNSRLTWQVNTTSLHLQGELVRDSLIDLYRQKNQFGSMTLVDITQLTKVDSAGLALLAQIALQADERTIEIYGASSELKSLVDAYRLPLVLV